VIGRRGARPLIPARREGAGPAACPAPGLRAPIDPTAAERPLSPDRGGRYSSSECRWKTGASFRSCRRHLRVFGVGRKGGVLTAAAGAGFSPGTVLSSLLSFSSSLLLCRRPPPAPSRAARVRGRKVGAPGGGRRWRADAHAEETPAGSVRPGAQGAPRPGLGGGGSRKGLSRGRRGRCCGGGLGCPGAKLWVRAPPVPVPSPLRSSDLSSALSAPSRRTRAFSG
jgi:hypothetical protein